MKLTSSTDSTSMTADKRTRRLDLFPQAVPEIQIWAVTHCLVLVHCRDLINM